MEIKELINENSLKDEKSIRYFYNLLDGYGKHGSEAMMTNDLRMNLSDDLLLYTDKISMHFSIETRVPILDNELIQFVESLPLKYRIKGNEGKYIHKKFAEKVLPKEIIYRKKKGFQSPTKIWFKREKGYIFKKLLTNPRSNFARYFNLERVELFFEKHFSGSRNYEKQLFTLISIYYWMENNISDD
jgi:asparagine synthase (glutamine-hydrolysing)